MSDASLAQAVASANGRVLIGLKDSNAVQGVDNSGRVLATLASAELAKARLRAHGVVLEYEFRTVPAVVGRISPALVASLRRSAWVDYLEPDARGEFLSQQISWGIAAVKGQDAWLHSVGSGVPILIMDSGIMFDHPDLNPESAYRCLSGPVQDVIGHGTFVAGVAAAVNNSSYVVGLSHAATLRSYNVEVGGAPSSAEVACAIEEAGIGPTPPFVVNMSFSLVSSAAVTDPIRVRYNEGMLFVASAGNRTCGGTAVCYPAKLEEVIAVSATTPSGQLAGFSSFGPEIDIAAPGENILSTSMPSATTCSSGGYTSTCSGTSFAAPHVTAAATLVKARYPWYSNVDVRNRLLSTASVIGPSESFGAGLLNACVAVGGCPAVYTATINGPLSIQPSVTCYWTASTNINTPNYEWRVNGVVIGTEPDLYYSSPSTFGLTLQVWNGAGHGASDTETVTVSGGGSNCEQV